MAKKSSGGLGRGFDTLIPQNFDSSLLVNEDERVQKLLITEIQPNKNQPRTHFDQQSLDELTDSIKRYGVLQPLVVTRVQDATYQIVAGERRWRAAKAAGLKSVPVIVRTIEELEQLEIALIENVQREDLSSLEQAASIQRLHDQFNLEYETIAQRLSKAESTVINIVRLLQLPEQARIALQKHDITEGHARSILALRDYPEKQLELLRSIIAKGWTVRQAEQFVVAVKKNITKPSTAEKRLLTTTPATQKLSTYIKAPVSLRRLAKGGKLEIAFKTDADLSRILKKLAQK